MYRPKGNLDSGIWEIFACGIRNTGKFGMWNPESWVLESRIQHKESRIPLTIIGFTDKTGIQYLESKIHCVESRIQDCLGSPHMGQKVAS